MTQQKPLFGIKELRIKLRKLTDQDIEEIGLQSFGNLWYYYPDQIKKLVKLVHKRLEGKNRA
jgi:hypothetical protein